jgi:hypothetical protein
MPGNTKKLDKHTLFCINILKNSVIASLNKITYTLYTHSY